MRRNPLSRRAFCVGLALTACSKVQRANADELPAALQASLLVKLAPYDRGLRVRAGNVVNIVLVTRAGSVTSERGAAQVAAALQTHERIADLPHVETTIAFASPVELARRCKELRASIVFVLPELVDSAEPIARAFDGLDILTAAPSMELVRRGVVLGFDLVSSKPKLFFNASAAKRQGISVASEVMKLMTVFS